MHLREEEFDKAATDFFEVCKCFTHILTLTLCKVIENLIKKPYKSILSYNISFVLAVQSKSWLEVAGITYC